MKSSGYNVSGNMNNTWSTSHLGKGITCLYTFASTYKTTNAARLKYFPNGWPEWSVALRGARMYDPRKDSTNGGSGSHRYLQSSAWTLYNTTWEWSENPAIVAAHYIAWLINQKLTAIININWTQLFRLPMIVMRLLALISSITAPVMSLLRAYQRFIISTLHQENFYRILWPLVTARMK